MVFDWKWWMLLGEWKSVLGVFGLVAETVSRTMKR